MRLDYFGYGLEKSSGLARAGVLATPHGEIRTPVFMPVGTAAAVKALDADDLRSLGAQIILGNTYHLYLRPGPGVIRDAGGLARFNSWRGPTLTDSGGFQVFSLKSLSRVAEAGVHFRSNVDGSPHFFTPESVIDIQRDLGADIIMPLDVCVQYPASLAEAAEAERHTADWARTARAHWLADLRQQTLFGIIQGSVYPELRVQAAERILALEFPGHAIGGLSVGEPKEIMWQILEELDSILPADKPRYLMGVGTPEDIVNAIGLGIDMFDCVMPTRNARNGTVFTNYGTLIVKSARYTHDYRPVEEGCTCLCCRNYSRSYLRHLLNVNEIAGLRLLTMHNLHFYLNTVEFTRRAILADEFEKFRMEFVKRYGEGEANVANTEEK